MTWISRAALSPLDLQDARRMAGAALLIACIASCSGSRVSRTGPDAQAPTSATVLTASELAESNRLLLDMLRQRLPSIQVTPTAACPEVLLRGKSTIVTSSSPAIYVDGNQANNTCILQELRTIDLELVEVYPGGIPSRPGYRNHPYGVILIFLRRAGV